MPTTTDPITARVKARIEREKDVLATRLEGANGQRAETLKTLVVARNQAGLAQAKVMELVETDKPVTETKAKAALKAIADERAALRAVIAAADTVAMLKADLKKLGTKAELDRRVQQAKEYNPDTDEPLSQREAVELVMMRAGRPMHYQEITRIGLETGLLRTDGETPEATVSAMLATRAKKGETFVKVDAGIFDLLPVEGETEPA